jgi:predicted Zn-dependent protease
MKMDDVTLPGHVQDVVARGQSAFCKQERFDTNYTNETLRALTPDQKRQHLRDSIFNALAQVAREEGGQPPMVERFREAAIIVESLEAKGMPFGVCPNSRMNKALRKLLNERAAHSNDNRKSRRKKIQAGAVQDLLRKIRQLRACDGLTRIPPYSD